jgi:hypothetical protein
LLIKNGEAAVQTSLSPEETLGLPSSVAKYLLFTNVHFSERISIVHFIEMIAQKTWIDPVSETEMGADGDRPPWTSPQARLHQTNRPPF